MIFRDEAAWQHAGRSDSGSRLLDMRSIGAMSKDIAVVLAQGLR